MAACCWQRKTPPRSDGVCQVSSLPSLIRDRLPAARYGRAFVSAAAYCLFQACDLQISPPNTQPLIFIEDPDSDALPE